MLPVYGMKSFFIASRNLYQQVFIMIGGQAIVLPGSGNCKL
jgi:hypothetical protein